jgi:cell division protein FtsI/penicillin-binding protein 2
MEKTQAANGTVVVQDVHTGQILALAVRPTFNPNDFRKHHAGAAAKIMPSATSTSPARPSSWSRIPPR